ncbi:MAG: saccharopine dehydrogenase NADP-binding domain-containing protein [Bacteroidota bacterium]
MQEKTFDIVVWGATGFTGKLVVEYLYQKYGLDNELKWAIAGRNQVKLDAVKQELGASHIPILIANSFDKSSLQEMASQAKVICSTVGPYALYGTLLVEACLENGTHYCDLTGEVQWMRKMIDQHHETAKEKKVKIVHCCGFDSIPSDYGIWFLQQEALKHFGQYCKEVKMRVKGATGGFSGGTYISLTNALAEGEKDPKINQVLADPYSLNPPAERSGKDQAESLNAFYDPDFKVWMGPFVMAFINTKVIRRSHALAGYPYGHDFSYSEAIWYGKGLRARIIANLSSLFMKLLLSKMSNSFLKKITDRLFPKPGQGPSAEIRDKGFFNLLFYGKTEGNQTIKVKVIGDKDPGYGSTSKMLAESAVCLAKDQDKSPSTYGVLTPSVAMGEVLFDRLINHAGITFELKN